MWVRGGVESVGEGGVESVGERGVESVGEGGVESVGEGEYRVCRVWECTHQTHVQFGDAEPFIAPLAPTPLIPY